MNKMQGVSSEQSSAGVMDKWAEVAVCADRGGGPKGRRPQIEKSPLSPAGFFP